VATALLFFAGQRFLHLLKLNEPEVITVERKIKGLCLFFVFTAVYTIFMNLFSILCRTIEISKANTFESKSYTTLRYPTMSDPEGSSIR